MKMNEKEINKKTKNLGIQRIERDIANKRKELKDDAYNFEQNVRRLKLIVEEQAAFEGQSKIIESHIKVFHTDVRREWEEQPEWWNLQAEVQRVAREKKAIEFEDTERAIVRHQENITNHIKEIKTSLLMAEIELKESKRKQE